ncbi:response regulator [Cohnella cellulosilytica]|uniref:Response regulator n=1 Tax=Cohnella cellulosilytica TaxID=986710 RepID=A0ABW2FNK4_9BACL
MRVLVVDDEPAMLLAMKRLLSKADGVELAGSFRNAAEALAFVKANPVDLAFLDIQIGEEDGLELARSLRELCAEADIVFTTSHAEYAMPAYDVYPLDYMVKPISGTRLAQTIARALGRRSASLREVGSGTSRHLTVRGLGSFEVVGRQAEEVKWISRRSAELFAYLLVHRGRYVARARILEDMFPDMPLRNAEIYLNTAAYQLRKALSQHGYRESILSTPEQYRVDLSEMDVDFIRFEQRVEELSSIEKRDEETALALEKRFTGELFGDKSYVWAAAERARLALVYEAFAKLLVNRLLARGRYREAAPIARRLVSRNEFDEESNLLLLKILEAAGDRQSFHASYERYSQLLLQELGVSPSEKMRRAYEQYSQPDNGRA